MSHFNPYFGCYGPNPVPPDWWQKYYCNNCGGPTGPTGPQGQTGAVGPTAPSI